MDLPKEAKRERYWEAVSLKTLWGGTGRFERMESNLRVSGWVARVCPITDARFERHVVKFERLSSGGPNPPHAT
jgi:hypothetical protein